MRTGFVLITALVSYLMLGLIRCDALLAIANPDPLLASQRTQAQMSRQPGDRAHALKPSFAEKSSRIRSPCSVDDDVIALELDDLDLLRRGQAKLTVSSHPTFLVYIPQYPTIQQAEFSVYSEASTEAEIFYYTRFNLPSQAGIIGITLPPEAPALEVGKTYTWYLTLICDENDRSTDIGVEGRVQRETFDAELSRQIERTSPRDRPLLYARAGIWYDAVATLAQLRLENPTDPAIATDWLRLLNSVDLERLAQQPILTITAYPAQPYPH
ncbi:MAG: DUF928 domain-containing protein [Oculatellaceae cyanobacterium bins.114]|nr:DUF928 domain-containing protein [Oculatellaceae cyanobacterium bins.114]